MVSLPLRRARWAFLLSALLVSACTSSPVVTTPVPTPVPSVTSTMAPTLPPVPAPSLLPRSPVPTPPAPAPVPRPLRRGGDVSWPSCPVGTPGALPNKQGKGLPLPGPEAQFVVIGLTNGPGFYANPCLAWEVAQLRPRLAVAAYAFTTLPNADQVQAFGGSGPYPTGTSLGRLRNAAWQQAQINLASLTRTGLRTPIIWMDVEPQPYLSPWGNDVIANRAAILAVRQAYRDAGYLTGFYSSDNPWRQITGGLRSDDPTWVTVGPRGRTAALAKCEAPTFSGGPAVLAQWWESEIEDLDLVCPRARGSIDALFARP